MRDHAGVLIAKILICVLLILSLTGCWNRRELDTLGIVMGIGIDKPNGPEKVQLTAQVVKPGEIGTPKKEGGSGGASDAFWNIQRTGNTAFGTLRDFTNVSSRKLFFPHNQVLIFGRGIAEEGVQEFIDFFVRDPETRVNVWVLVSTQNTAAEVLDVKSQFEKVPANNIGKLVQTEAAAASEEMAVRLRDFITRLMSKTTAPIAPIIEISREGNKKSVMLNGTAVFKRDKLIGKLSKSEGRGLLWVLGEVKSCIIEAEGPGGDLVSLETIRARGKIEPVIEDNKIIMRVHIMEEGNVGEQTGPENLSKLPEVAALEEKKAKVIRSEVMAAVKKAKELDADIFGFGEAIHQRYPKQWKELESKWDEIFPDIQVEVDVKAKLRLMGRVIMPAVPPEREK